MLSYESIVSNYFKFSDRSNFAPYLSEEGDLTIFYSDDSGLQKAHALSFAIGAQPKYEFTEQKKIYELLEKFGDRVDDSGLDDDTNEFEDDAQNILSSSYNDVPMIRLVNQIVIYAVRNGASDIHFEGRDNSFLVRLRTDGILNTFKKYPKSVQEPVIARTKVIASLDVAETRRTQDGRINLKVGNRQVDIRVSTMPSINGEKAVLRILDRSSNAVSLKDIGMTEELLKKYSPFLTRPNGIILVTGPTGSGKTTTLYASLLSMNRENKNILTIEDPVEYHIDNITQVQVNAATNITFANAIRAFLRQDPDVILVGEIRDDVTAEAAVQASLTGHLVLSTLHTNDAPTAVSRLIEMGVEPFLLSSSLMLVVGQRLVRKVCPKCQEEVAVETSTKEIFDNAGHPIYTYHKGKGCDNCFNTGYRGRVGVFELLIINDDIRKLVNNKASSYEILAEARKHGFITMFEQGVQLIRDGVTTPEELLTVTKVD